MALTIQDIHQAADELVANGIKPTLSEVRKALGGGSFTTISDAMKVWHEEHQEVERLQQVDLPEGISERLQVLGADVWQTAIDMANDRLSKDREALELVKAQSEQEVVEWRSSVSTLEGEREELLLQLDALSDRANTSDQQASVAISERESLAEQLAESKHIVDLERSKIETLTEQLGYQVSQSEKQTAEILVLRETVATCRAEAESHKDRVSRLSSELESAQIELKENGHACQQLEITLATATGEIKAIRDQRDALIIERDELVTANAELISQLGIADMENKQLSVVNETLTEKISELHNEYQALKVTMGKLEGKRDQLLETVESPKCGKE